MPEVLEMPRSTQQDNREAEEREIRSRKEEAVYHFKQIKQASVLQSRNSLRIGYHAFALKEKNLWGMLGHRDEQEAREAAGVGESTWFATMRIAEAFKGVPEELFVNMKLSNAKALSDLPESKRQDREWLKAAADDSLKDFQAKVDLEMNGKTKESEGREPIQSFKTTLPASAKKKVEEGLKHFAESAGLDPANTGKALEVMVAEHTGGAGLIGAITTAVAKIKAAKSMAHSGLSAEEALERVEKTLDEIVLEFAAALDQASQRGSEAA